MAYHPKIIEFFKKHNMYNEKTFKYLNDNTTQIDYNYEDERMLIGCFYVLNQKDILKSLKLVIPYVTNHNTALINIHEITHGIENYYRIGNKFKKDITIEALPLMYEKLYIMENPSQELIAYGEYLDKLITTERIDEYVFGLAVRETLIENYSYNMQKSQALVKKLAKKYPTIIK